MTTEARVAAVHRVTSESDVEVKLNLDGTGESVISTGVGFYDHMLTALSRHSLIDMEIKTTGDIYIDGHHSIEDTAIAIGQALKSALGDKRGIRRYGFSLLPMDEALAECAIDISGRPFLAWSVPFARDKVGEMDTELFEEFFRALAFNAGITMHMTLKAGTNAHHVAEACFKAAARALRQATEPDPRAGGAIPSTKGVLEA